MFALVRRESLLAVAATLAATLAATPDVALGVALGVGLGSMLAGCSPEPPQGDTVTPSPSMGDGRFVIAWTLGGSSPSSTSCAGVEELRLEVVYAYSGSISLAPIPCTLTKFRYDGMPEGDARFDLAGYDANGCRVTRGSAEGQVSTELPERPDPLIALSALTRCR